MKFAYIFAYSRRYAIFAIVTAKRSLAAIFSQPDNISSDYHPDPTIFLPIEFPKANLQELTLMAAAKNAAGKSRPPYLHRDRRDRRR